MKVKTSPLGIALMFLNLFVIIALSYLVIDNTNRNIVEKTKSKAANRLNIFADHIIRERINSAKLNVKIVSGEPLIQTYLKTGNVRYLNFLKDEIGNLLLNKKDYRKINILNKNGVKVLSVEKSNKGEIVLKINRKADRTENFYFKKSFFSKDNEVIIGLTNFPAGKYIGKNLIFSAPIKNYKGKIIGVAELEYSLQNSFRMLNRQLNKHGLGKLALIDESGNNLLPEANGNLKEIIPILFKDAQLKFAGSFNYNNKIFVYRVINLNLTLNNNNNVNSPFPGWLLISKIDRLKIEKKAANFKLAVVLTDLILIGLFFTFAFFYLNYKSQRIKSAQKLKESENKYEKLMETIPLAVVITDKEKILFVNKYALKEAGLKDYSKVIGRNILDFVHPESKKSVKTKIEKLFTGDSKIERGEEKLLTIKGETLITDLVATTIKFNNKLAIQVVFNDVTEKRKAEEELRKNEQIMRTVLNNSLAQIYIVNKDYELEFVNRRGLKILGYDPVKKKEKCYQAFFKANKPCDFCRNDEVFAGKTINYEVNFPDGRTMEVYDSPLSDLDGKELKVSVLHDITNRIKVQKELENYVKTLNEVQKLANIGFYERNLKTNEGFWSDGLYKIFGLEVGEVPPSQQSFFNIVHPEDIENLKKGIENSLHSKKPLDMVVRIIEKSGKIKYLHSICEFVYNEKGEPVTHRGTFINVTNEMREEFVKDLLFEISGKTGSQTELKDLLRNIHDKLKEIIDARNFLIAFYNVKNDSYYSPYFRDEFTGFSTFNNKKLSGGLIDYVRKTGEPLLLTSKELEKLLQNKKIKLIGEQAKAWMGVPLIFQEKTTGVLAVQSYTNPAAYSYDDLKLLSIIGNNLAAIIERHRILQELQKSEQKFKSLFDDALNMIHILDNNGIFIDVNKAELNKLGYSREELIGVHYLKIVHPDFASESKQIFKEVLKGKNKQFECVFVNKNGESIDVEIKAFPQFEDGKVVNIRAIINDVTEKKKAEKKLIEQKRYINNLFCNIAENIFVIDKNYVIKDVNKNLLSNIGYTKEEVIGKHCYEISHSSNEPCNLRGETCNLQEVFENKQSFNYRHVHYDKNNNERYIDIILSPLEDAEGNVIRAIEASRDITDLILAERSLQNKEKKYQQLFDNILAGVFETTIDGEIVNCNDTFARIFGYENADELIGKRAEILYFTKNDRREFIKELFEKKVLLAREYRLKRKDGSAVWVLENSTLLESGLIFGTEIEITDKKIIEQQLNERQMKLAAFVESAPYAIITTDSGGKITEWNKTAEELFGYKKSEAVGKDLSIILPDKFLNLHTNAFKKALIRKEIGLTKKGPVEIQAKRKDGKLFFADISLSLFTVNEKTFITANIRDITSKKKAELEIRKLSAAISQNPVSIIILDLNWNIEYVNEYFTKITGFRKEEVIGKNSGLLKSSRTPKKVFDEIQKVVSAGGIWKGELLSKKKNGDEYWEEITFTPVKNDEGEIINYCALKSDISERKRLESELKEYQLNLEKKIEERTKELKYSEEKYRTLAENMEEYIARLDENNNIIYSNKALLKLTSAEKNKVLGKSLFDLHYEEEITNFKKIKDVIEKVRRTGKTQKLETLMPWGIWIEWTFEPEFKFEKKGGNILILGHDITKIKKAEESLKQALIKERELSNLKTRFISTVSHEFRTPLTSILSSVEMLKYYGSKWDEKKKEEHYSRIKEAISRLTEMMDDVLTISRKQSGKMKLNVKKDNLKKFLNSLTEQMKNILTEKQIFEMNYLLDTEEFLFDRNILSYILTNLLSNAIKYTPQGKIIFNVEKEKNWLKFEITDEGIGIPEEDLKNIFAPFHRANNTGKIGGTGLGLTIVKENVQLHKGIISLKSKINEGSTFIVKIPVEINSSSQG